MPIVVQNLRRKSLEDTTNQRVSISLQHNHKYQIQVTREVILKFLETMSIVTHK